MQNDFALKSRCFFPDSTHAQNIFHFLAKIWFPPVLRVENFFVSSRFKNALRAVWAVKKSPNVYKSCPKKNLLEKWKILTPLKNCPKNVEQFVQKNCYHRLWKAAQIAINRPIWSHWIWEMKLGSCRCGRIEKKFFVHRISVIHIKICRDQKCFWGLEALLLLNHILGSLDTSIRSHFKVMLCLWQIILTYFIRGK